MYHKFLLYNPTIGTNGCLCECDSEMTYQEDNAKAEGIAGAITCLVPTVLIIVLGIFVVIGAIIGK
jgi:hypothetical protein